MNLLSRTIARLWLALTLALAVLGAAGPAAADSQLSALARIDPGSSAILANSEGTRITLGLSQPVPFRAYMLDDPRRLVVDFREVDFSGLTPEAMLATQGQGTMIRDLRWGRFRPGWSRMVAELSAPAAILTAVEDTGDDPHVEIRLVRSTPAAFAAKAGAPSSALWDLPQPAQTAAPHRRQDGGEPLRVVLDPGHGGIDPGAEIDGLQEKVLTLTFARELKEQMTRAGMSVTMTRTEDVFVPLEDRITIARNAGADLFIALHADILSEGQASGATIYQLDEKSEDEASRKLAERHDRDDLLAGVDLAGHDDGVAGVLMDLARTETQPRSVRLAQVLAGAIRGANLPMHRHPVQKADFSVLKAPDIPSVLVELGFLSSPDDRRRLLDDGWRRQMAGAITQGVLNWAKADAAEARLLRR
ncbi:N-acetylmuramoyl-L-alanine amidase [Paenirhodobacter enshiensis]|uniref:N-acetylmuramoyl-L-alanine amidase n=1 Tax=Paenirhodobacter enshiensis TaxID=1105367 RepID=A0A086Y8Y6_9RHOB|nr:N-acetylmuramoyl-L-alanine amidase [Paenirhodobacter enshiensis]KFI30736.1 N-acetylmuramoyl-L-alanine amidase [Paenirhodobacter enshiensis]